MSTVYGLQSTIIIIAFEAHAQEGKVLKVVTKGVWLKVNEANNVPLETL